MMSGFEGAMAMSPMCNVFKIGHRIKLEIASIDSPREPGAERTDIFHAKEVLGDIVCIRGNVPLSVLCTGNPDDVKEYCKRLINVVGKGGGFIMDASTVLDDAKPENVKALYEFTREYGRYD